MAAEDPRARHIREVLRMKAGDRLYVGALHGPRGMAVIHEDGHDLVLAVTWEASIPSFRPVQLVCGLPRPQAARRILQEATSLGVEAIHFFASVRGEASYRQSTLWTSGEWRRHLHLGAEQAFSTRLPDIVHHDDLAAALGAIDPALAIALDVYEATGPLQVPEGATRATVILGAERGFDATERDLLREQRIPLQHLGERVLRVETACLAGLASLIGQIGAW